MEQLGLIPWGAKSWSLPMGGLHLFSGACSSYNVPILAWVPAGSYLSWWHGGIDDEGGDLTVFLQNSILRKAKQAAVCFPLKQALFPCVFDLFTVQMAGWEHRVKMGLLDQISKARQISWDKNIFHQSAISGPAFAFKAPPGAGDLHLFRLLRSFLFNEPTALYWESLQG